jgi:hypothetical protein
MARAQDAKPFAVAALSAGVPMMMVTVPAPVLVSFRLVVIFVPVSGHSGMRGFLVRAILSPTGQAQKDQRTNRKN